MAERQYIGARYVPKFFENSLGTSEWVANTAYEALTIVTRNGNSYTSKIPVPASVGAPEDNANYWVSTGIYNSQIEELSDEVSALDNRVDAIEDISDAVNAPPVNILLLGGKNDGSADIGAIINQYTSQFDIYLPSGEYLVTTPILLTHSLIGAHGGQYYESGSAVIKSTISSGAVITINEAINSRSIRISGLIIDCNSYPVNCINFIPSIRVYLTIYDVCIKAAKCAFNLSPTVSGSRWVDAHDFYLFGADEYDTIYGSIGININNNCNDCSFTDFMIMGYCNSMMIYGGGTRITSAHLYTANGSVAQENKQAYFRATACVNCYNNVIADNIYLDTALQYWVQRSDVAMLGNVMCWNDGWFDATGDTDAGFFSTRGSAKINIDNLVVGGSRTTIANIIDTKTVAVNRFSVRWNAYDDNANRTLSSTLKIGGGLIDEVRQTTRRYVEVARVHCRNNGCAKFIVGTGSGITEFLCRASNAGALNSIAKISETFAQNFYYKMVGWDCVVFIDTGSETTKTFSNSINIVATSGENVGLIDYTSYPALIPLEQSDTTGLTTIT